MSVKSTIYAIQTGKCIRLLSCTAFALFALYIYFVSAATFSAANWKEIEQKLGETKTNLSAVESEYFKTANEIDLKLAQSLGYRNTSEDTTYVSRAHAVTARLTAGNAGL